MGPAGWKCLHASKLQRNEHITRSEARALLWTVRHALRPLRAFNSRILCLVDNMSLSAWLLEREGRGARVYVPPCANFAPFRGRLVRRS